MSENLQVLLTETLRLAREAGDIALAMREQPLQIVGKDGHAIPSDIVTEADLASESHLLSGLRGLRQGDTFIAEESGASAASGTGLTWHIDPIDGTTNYARGLPEWAISLAAVDSTTGDTVLSVIHAPALRSTWYALGGDAYVQQGETPARPLHHQPHGTGPLINVGFPYDPAQRARVNAALPELGAIYGDIRSIGACSVHLALVASGTLDAMLEVSIRTWDYMAGAHILQAVGGPVTVLANPHTGGYGIVATGIPARHTHLAGLLQRLLS